MLIPKRSLIAMGNRGTRVIAWCLPLIFSATALAAAPSTSSSAPEDKEEALEDIDLMAMDVPVVVTATRREEKSTNLPYAVSVITAEDIRRSGARSVPDALRLVPGVDVADLLYGQSAVSPRGFHGFLSRQVLVLMDGRQMYDGVNGGIYWGTWPFQLEDIERIEVIRGPGGVTWGANAVNGVINIITKDPRDQKGVTVTGGGGTHGANKEHFGYAFQEGKLRLRVSTEQESSDGFTKGGSFLRNLNDRFQIERFGLHAIYDAGPRDTITFSGGNGVLDGGYAPPPLGGFGLHHDAGSVVSYMMGTWTHKVAPDNSFKLIGYVNDYQGSNGLPQVDYRYDQLALLFNHTFKPTENHTIIWGIDGRVDLVDTSNADPFMLTKDHVNTSITGIYLQDEWRLAPKWTLNLGGRIDYDAYGGFQPSARVALSRELTKNHMIYGAISRAFQMAPAGLRFMDIPMVNGLARARGDRDVDAETLIAYELGHKGKFFNRLETNTNVFWHQFSDMTTMSMEPGPPGLIALRLKDRADAAMYGLEMDAKYKVNPKLTLLGNYTYQQLNWNAEVPFTDKEVMSPPKHKFMTGARYDLTTNLHLAAHLYYVDAVHAPNPSLPFLPLHISQYFKLDLQAEYEFWNKRASVAVGVKNLLDPEHPEGSTLFLNQAEVPRMVFAQLRVNFP